MYIVYDRLWELMLSKKISKTDLCNLTGLSSRTMAKLSKNQSVTTDTLLLICGALECQLSDIAEVKQESGVTSVYEAFLHLGRRTWENELLECVEFSYRDCAFAVYVTKKKASKKMFAHCDPQGNVSMETVYPLGISPAREVKALFHSSKIQKDRVTLLVITGNCGGIVGLDNGIVRSAKRGYENGKFYVMSMSAFKVFEKQGG